MSTKEICLIALILVVALVSITSCGYIRWRDFGPIKRELPISMFGKYKLEMLGYASGSHNMYFELSFTNETKDTTSLDTIPILLIDSFCIYGDCLDTLICYQPESWYETYEEIGYIVPSKMEMFGSKPIRKDDLWINAEGILVPGGYTLTNVLRLPKTCVDSSLTIDLFARLIDRISNEEIANEVKRIRMLIKDIKRIRSE